ncbi:CAAX amino terminal protease family protein [hydrothermal vent metagenome]|uniref:CAAX amino terminal protease family protein n=1 Tax=hydrothermal vent metagenome TaxID=652676 RepID=A0A3B0S0F5_9ZZZZ
MQRPARAANLRHMRYDPYETLITPARPSSNPLRLTIGFVLGAALYMLLLGFFVGFVAATIATDGNINRAINMILAAATPQTMLFTLFSFVLMIASLWFVLKLIHKRSLASLLGPFRIFRRQFLRVSAFLLAFQAFLFLLPATEDVPMSPGLDFGVWLKFLPFALIALMIQVSAEEMVFRGYAQSQLAARFSHPIIWIGLPSALFGWLHYDPGVAGGNAWIIAVMLGLFAATAADITARSGTLGPAIALHLFNNINALLIAAPAGNYSGLALYTFPLSSIQNSGNGMAFALNFVIILCGWLVARLALRR